MTQNDQIVMAGNRRRIDRCEGHGIELHRVEPGVIRHFHLQPSHHRRLCVPQYIVQPFRKNPLQALGQGRGPRTDFQDPQAPPKGPVCRQLGQPLRQGPENSAVGRRFFEQGFAQGAADQPGFEREGVDSPAQQIGQMPSHMTQLHQFR